MKIVPHDSLHQPLFLLRKTLCPAYEIPVIKMIAARTRAIVFMCARPARTYADAIGLDRSGVAYIDDDETV